MRTNRLKTLWREGRPAVSGWLSIPAPFSAEIMAHQGWDALTVDLQHGLIDYQTAVDMLTAISTTETVPLARVPWLEFGLIMKLLDAGAYGVICPMVNTREDAQNLVRAGRYPPAGTRSFGPVRAAIYGGADYVENANDEIVLLAMIETEEALDNVKEIAAVSGLDGLFIGPNDLAKSLGRAPRLDTDDPLVAPAIAAHHRDRKSGRHRVRYLHGRAGLCSANRSARGPLRRDFIRRTVPCRLGRRHSGALS